MHCGCTIRLSGITFFKAQKLRACLFQILELMKGLNESTLSESAVCSALIQKYSSSSSIGVLLGATLPPVISSLLVRMTANRESGVPAQPTLCNTFITQTITETYQTESEALVRSRIVECLEALRVFDQLDSAVEHLLSRVATQCQTAIFNTTAVLRLVIHDCVSDASHLVQLCHVVLLVFK